MPFQIIRHNIAEVDAECIINTTSTVPEILGGSDLTIHQYAGEELLRARREFGLMDVGDVHITKGYNLKAKYVIHMAAPTWFDDHASEKLRHCYDKAFALADEHHIQSLAFPLVGAGTYRFPREVALKIVLDAVSDFCMTHTMDLILVVFDKEAFRLSQRLHNSVQSYIEDNFVDDLVRSEYVQAASNLFSPRRARAKESPRPAKKPRVKDYSQFDETVDEAVEFSIAEDFENCETAASTTTFSHVVGKELSLDDLLRRKDDTFAEALLDHIDRRGLSDAYVYKKANISRKLFNKIKLHPDYQPRKSTCLAIAIALELNLDETIDLLAHAGYTLTHSSKFDIIVEYFILQREYNIFEINAVLFDYDCPLLGSR